MFETTKLQFTNARTALHPTGVRLKTGLAMLLVITVYGIADSARASGSRADAGTVQAPQPMQALLEGVHVPGMAMASLRNCETVAVSNFGIWRNNGEANMIWKDFEDSDLDIFINDNTFIFADSGLLSKCLDRAGIRSI